MIRAIFTTAVLGLAVCACGPQRPAIDPALDSGVTSSNGGGTRALGNNPGVSVGSGVATNPGIPNSRGPAY